MNYFELSQKVIQSKAFRRLAHKTQVFGNHEFYNDHCRTRLTHTLEVAFLARQMALSQRVNPYATEYLALVHDIGHPPFGHAGEEVLNDLSPEGFDHHTNATRVLLSEGIVPLVLDEQAVRIVEQADDRTYIVHDIEDGLRCGALNKEKLKYCSIYSQAQLQETSLRDVAYRCDDSVIKNSRTFLDVHLYETENKKAIAKQVRKILTTLWVEYQHRCNCLDYIAGMTDRFAIKKYEEFTGEKVVWE